MFNGLCIYSLGKTGQNNKRMLSLYGKQYDMVQ